MRELSLPCTCYLSVLQFTDFTASNAGTRAVTSHPMHREAAQVLANPGGETADFAARQLAAKIASDAELVFTMTKAYSDAVPEVAPCRRRRAFTLTEAARVVSEWNAQTVADFAALRSRLAAHELTDIPDPIGQGADVFSTVGSQIVNLLPSILGLCRRNASSPVSQWSDSQRSPSGRN